MISLFYAYLTRPRHVLRYWDSVDPFPLGRVILMVCRVVDGVSASSVWGFVWRAMWHAVGLAAILLLSAWVWDLVMQFFGRPGRCFVVFRWLCVAMFPYVLHPVLAGFGGVGEWFFWVIPVWIFGLQVVTLQAIYGVGARRAMVSYFLPIFFVPVLLFGLVLYFS